MTQDEKLIAKYNEVIDFIETNHRNPSKHRVEEHLLLNWVKQQRKLLNAGTLKAGRVIKLNNLLTSLKLSLLRRLGYKRGS